MKKTLINNKFELYLPEHRADRPEWQTGWEVERIDAMISSLQPGSVIFDIGTEEGDMSALLAKYGESEIVVFEPNPLVWPNIRAIFEANKLRIKDYFVGFASNETILTPPEIEKIIAEPARDGWPACAYGELIGNHGFRNISERTHDTPSLKVDDYVNKTGILPDIITIDVEGAEFLVLQGAEQVLKEQYVEVFVSIHPEVMFSQYGTYTSDIIGFMHKLGYTEEFLAFDHEFHFKFSTR